VGLESILGIRRQGNKLYIDPCIPPEWPEYSIDYRFGNTNYHIHVENPVGAYHAVSQVILDGRLLSDYVISLENDGKEHEVSIVMK